MKKYQVISSIALIAVMSATVVVAAPVDKEAKTAERDAKAVEREVSKVERKVLLDDKKAEREATIADKKAEVEAKKVEKTCERVDKAVLRLKEQSQKRKDTGMDKIEKRLAQVQERRTVQNKELETQRQKRDGQRETFYSNLEAKAQTDEQIVAVATFKAILEEAVIVRREAIDVATLALQEDVDALTTEKVAAIEVSYVEYQTSYDAAIATAEGACSEDATTDDLKNIAKELNGELKTANIAFRKEVQAMRQIGPEVQELVAVRKAAVKDAIDAFKVTVDAARADLIAAFGGELNVDVDEDSDVDEDESENKQVETEDEAEESEKE